jgi:type IV secretory pathway VirB9-like protein
MMVSNKRARVGLVHHKMAGHLALSFGILIAGFYYEHAHAAEPAKPVSGVREIKRGSDPVMVVQSALSNITKDLSSGAQVAVFPYRANRIYQVDIKPGMFTTFTFPKSEVIRQFAVSNPDAAEISVNADTNAAMVRLSASVTISATVVTDKHVYYLTISPSSGAWHQGVSWSYDEDGVASGFGYRAPAGAAPIDTSGYGQEDSLAGHPNFNYSIEGDSAVSPISVWDNGRFTWMQFPNSVQSLPAVFYLGPDGPEVVNYTVSKDGKQIKVNRLMDKMLLRLGSLKATVTAR